ncbi:VCBS repeat-containing protein [Candidatus Woesearchaeota archaeon]|nr:VCBS repeat-containing protein [Candidatus Woesearchaeota archaeon]
MAKAAVGSLVMLASIACSPGVPAEVPKLPQPGVVSTLPVNATSIAGGDFDGDNLEDLVVAGNIPGKGGVFSAVYVLWNNGSGYNDPKLISQVPVGDPRVYVADVNGDRRPDVVVVGTVAGSGGSKSNVYVIKNMGNARFALE